MKTTFSRQVALIAALLLVCMLFTGVSFRFLMLRYLKNDKKETLSADAQAVASLAEAYDSTGELEENWDFRLRLSLFSVGGEAEAQVCDENGFVVLCSCDEFNCEHLGRQIDADLITEIDMNGETFRVGTLTGIHDGRRYIAGRPIVSDDTEQTIGYVIISSDMSQITDFMQRSSSLFFYSASIVLVLSMAAATFLSHQQVQPLNKVAEAARRFGRGELDTRVEVPKSCGEEIVDLANAFNTMADSLRAKKKELKGQLQGIDGLGFRKINDEKECATLLTLLFDTKELADKFCAAMGTAPIAKSGWHVYNNMEQILDKKTWTDNHPFHLSDRTYEKHMLPQTDDILDRAVNISIGVVDKGLGSGCGININSTEEEITATAKHIREVLAGL